MLTYAFLFALLVPALVSAQATNGARQCTGSRPFIQELRIAGCSQTPCDVFQGSDAIMQIDFRAPFIADGLRPVVFATAIGETIEYHLSPEFQIACNHLSRGSCPLSLNEDATYNFVFRVTAIYPPIPVTVELTLVDQTNTTVFCTLIDIHVRLR